ncbi:MAG TPA: c-type cytochrome [Gammaproteobacteria bacterium]|nr:c-type cytochrome [Gammaproteobacteria bacterium]
MSVKTTQYQRPGARALIPALALLVLLGAGCSEKETTAPEEAAPAKEATQPMVAPEAAPPAEAPEPAATAPAVEEPAADAPAETQAAAVDGEQIYKSSCQVCHAAGVAGAPKAGDKAAWAPRIAKGNNALLSSVMNGLNAMPPKGACMTCSDDELRAALQYLVDQGS